MATTMRLNIVSPDHGWIFDKIARNIKSNNVEIMLSDGPNDAADVNYYINWFTWYMLKKPRTKCDVLFFTHINKGQGRLAAGIVNEADHTTTMSDWERERLIEHGANPDKLTTVLPGMDATWSVPKLRVGITCRFYDDGRRREEDMIEMARRGALQDIELYIIGQGWGPVLEQMEQYNVQGYLWSGSGDYEADYDINHGIVPTLDYLWHPGRDTTLGVLDALACGVPIICPPTSFAVQFAIEPGSAYWYQNVDQLEAIFRELVHRNEAKRALGERIGARARARTWDVYTKELIEVLERVRGESNGVLEQKET